VTAREIAKRRDETTRRRFKKEKKRRQKPEERVTGISRRDPTIDL
jgi:hypothetical protein